MITNSGSPVSPKVTIEIGESSVNYLSISKLTLNLSSNKHDMLTLQMAGIPAKAITDYIDAPVRVTATLGSGRRFDFYGYVLYIEPEYTAGGQVVNGSQFQVANIVCFGASVNMKSTNSKIWENCSVVSIARELSDKYGFSVDVVNDGFSIPQVAQAKKSDWGFLSWFCDTYGYAFTVHGTHMHIWDPFKAIGRRPSFEVLVSPNNVASAQPGGILRFNGSFGYLTPDGVSWNYQVDSLDNSGVSVTSTGDHLSSDMSWSGVGHRSKYTSALSASSNSIIESEKIIGAKIRKNLPFNAVLDVHAALGTVPGGVVKVTGYGAKFEGLWYVNSVRHVIGGSSCISTLDISRDFNLTSEYIVPPTELAETPPTARYVNGEWKTSLERVVEYV